MYGEGLLSNYVVSLTLCVAYFAQYAVFRVNQRREAKMRNDSAQKIVDELQEINSLMRDISRKLSK